MTNEQLRQKKKERDTEKLTYLHYPVSLDQVKVSFWWQSGHVF